MTVAEEQGEQEKLAAEQIIASEPLFDGIQSVDVELGDDHTGDPSLWVIFRMRRDFDADDQWIERFAEYSTKFTIKLIDSGLTRFPYTRLKTAA